MRLIPALIALFALAACDRAAKERPATAPVDAREVAAADAYGEAGDIVNAVAFWSHPSVNFEGLVIAATDEGLKAFSIETGEVVAAFDGVDADGLVVFYSGNGATAKGYVAAASAQGYRIFAIDNATRTLTPLGAPFSAPASAGFCIARQGAAFTLYEPAAGKITARTLRVSDQGVLASDPVDFVQVENVDACHADDRTGDVIAVSGDGTLRRITAGGESFGLSMVEGLTAEASAIALNALPGHAIDGGQVALLDAGAGIIRLFGLADGRALGAVRVKETFDLEAVASAATIAIGHANYGGVYRDGALAVVTAGDGAPIRLVPWNGVLDALELPLGAPIDPRWPQVEGDDDDFLSIELKQP